jgi:hypothetical protein
MDSTSSFIWATPLELISSGNLLRPPETVNASLAPWGVYHNRRGTASRLVPARALSGSWDVRLRDFLLT